LRWLDIRRCRSNCNPNRRLGIDDLGGTLFGIGNRNHHDRKSFFIAAPAVAAGSLECRTKFLLRGVLKMLRQPAAAPPRFELKSLSALASFDNGLSGCSS
jgi:hypothetical protein